MSEIKHKITLLIAKKDKLKKSLSASVEAGNSALVDPSKLGIFKSRIQKLDSLYGEYEETIESLNTLQLESIPDFKPDYQSLLSFEETYHQIQACYQSFQDQAGPSIISFSEKKPNQTCRLPKINLPRFDGSLKTWTTFYDQFLNLVHLNQDISSVEKFHYLISSVSGAALSIVKSLPLSEANYTLVWDALLKRYQNKRVLGTDLLDRMLNFHPIKSETSDSLNSFLNEFGEAVNALQTLKFPDLSGFILLYLSLRCLPFETRKNFERHHLTNEVPTWDQLFQYIQSQARVLEVSHSTPVKSPERPSSSKLDSKPSYPSHKKDQFKPYGHNNARRTLVSSKQTSHFNCIVCNQSHTIYRCPDFLRLPISERIEKIRSLNLCLNCLKNHNTSNCPSLTSCQNCGARHNSLLCLKKSNTFKSSQPTKVDSTTPASGHVSVHDNQALPSQSVPSCSNVNLNSEVSSSFKTVLLGTALIHVQDARGSFQLVRALIDSGAQTSFVTSSCVQRLGLTTNKCNFPVLGIGQNVVSNTRGITSCVIKPRDGANPKLYTEAVVLPKITSDLPSINLSESIYSKFKNLSLADPFFCVSSSVDMLLAADLFPSIYDGKKIPGQPCALHSIFGWVITGLVESSFPRSVITCCLTSTESQIDKTLQRFWECEESPKSLVVNPDDSRCEEIYKKFHSRDSDGRYIVPLPFAKQPPFFSITSYQLAKQRFSSLERRLARHPALKISYQEFMDEYEKLGHMTKVSNRNPSENSYFIPHHAVFKESSSTTKVRVVFDASSCLSNQPSLNNVLFAGPKCQRDIVDIICRFRLHTFVFIADISKMFRQIWVRKEDRAFQYILWRKSPELPLEEFMLNTVTYGVTSSPYLAIRSLLQLAEDEYERFPLAANLLRRDVYTDDAISGSSTLPEAQRLIQELIELLKAGGFELRKWSSNCPALLKDIPSSHRETPLSFDPDGHEVIKLLGVQWCAAIDSFSYQTISIVPICTKRSILSHIARMYDPLGWLSPVIFRAKCIIQHLWRLGLGWDEEVPKYLAEEWQAFCETLPSLSLIKIPRQVVESEYESLYLVGFCDASDRGYCAAVYLVSASSTSQKVHLLLAKSKVAPLKALSVPRLELCGALLLSKLLVSVQATFAEVVTISDIRAYTDSTTVLSWLRTPIHLLKTYVSARVSQILDMTLPCCWHHVTTDVNPADCGSRGLRPNQLQDHPLWWSGSPWLTLPISEWPTYLVEKIPADLPELKNTATVNSFLQTVPPSWELISKYSSLTKLQRVTAWCLRFKANIDPRNPTARCLGPLSCTELTNSLNFLLKVVQQETFSSDIQLISQGKDPRLPALQRLRPFLDPLGLLRVGGRLKNSDLPDTVNPVILPKSSILSSLLVDFYHKKYLHVGPRALQSLLCRLYWILSVRSLIRSRLSKCLTCFKFKASPYTPIMGDLPLPRVSQARPFLNVGLDYGGPFTVKENKRRNARLSKCWLCLFVCLSTKAIHLELVSDLSTDSFLASLYRFVSRRGLCHNIYSDNGTNFVGASNHLKELYNFLKTTEPHICDKLNQDQVKWHFSAPAAPHFNGLAEAGIKSVKLHLKKVIGDQAMTFEEFYTLLTKVEAILNSRPLCPLSSDPCEVDVLTPGHFLIGGPLLMVPEHNLTELPLNRLSRWQLIQRCNQSFWDRWSRDYLHTLQQRSKWSTNRQNIKVGDLVILIEARLPPMQWRIGRVEEVHPGNDGVVRVVKVQTSQGTYLRPVVKLCPLPTQ